MKNHVQLPRPQRFLAFLFLLGSLVFARDAGAAATGSVVVWGDNDHGQRTIPLEAQSGVIAVSAGDWNIVALRSDGQVVGWGYSGYGLAPVPAAAQSGVIAIAAGVYHTLALKDNGSVLGWGDNWQGQVTIPAAAQSGVKAIAAGDFQGLALKQDGTVVVWGATQAGSFSLDFGQGRTHPDAQTNVIAIASGRYHNLALKSDGRVVAWGWNGFGQTNVPSLAQTGVVAVAAANFHSVALRGDGRVVAWGAGSPGDAPDQNYNHGQSIVPVAAQRGVVAVAAGSYHTVALKDDGSIISWGANITGETNGTPNLGGAVAIGAGGHNTVAIVGPPSAPTIITQPISQTVDLGNVANFNVKVTGFPLTYQWRKDGTNILGATSSILSFNVMQESQAGEYSVVVTNSMGSVTSAPPAVLTVTVRPPVIVTAPASQTNHVGRSVSFFVEATGSLLRYQWRKNGIDISGGTGSTLNLGPAQAGFAGEYSVVVSSDLGVATSPPATLSIYPASLGAVVVWGGNEFGQQNVPASVGESALEVVCGWGYVGALRSDGAVFAWGSNQDGQSTVPAAAQSGVTTIAAGSFFMLAVKNGSVIAWGQNGFGQASVPASASSGVVKVAAGPYHSVALKNDGSVVGWGNNEFGQTSIPAAAQSGVVAIATGETFSLALKTDGSVVAWGKVLNGGSFLPITVPAMAQSGVSQINAGGGTAAALKPDGSVVLWGSINWSQTNSIGALPTDVRAMAMGFAHGLFVRSDNSILAMGYNPDGRTSVPPGLRSTGGVGAGWHNSAAIVTPTAPTIITPPASKSVEIGGTNIFTVTASGHPLRYQWRRDGADIPSATNVTYFISNAQITNSGAYTVVVSNSMGSVTSAPPAVLTVAVFPAAITLHPADRTVEIGRTNILTVTATGSALRYQWRKDGVDIPSATNATYFISNAQTTHSGSYTVVVSNSVSSVTSQPAVLTVAVFPPTITLQPVGRTVEIGTSNIFTVNATGSALRYQWRKDGVDIPSATNATYVISNAQINHSGSYTVVVSNSASSVTSQPAVLTVTVFPAVITLHPVSRTVNEGQSASFYVTATGSQLTYQWRKDGVDISGATGATFNLGPARSDLAGEYTVVVSNAGGSVTSAPAMLTVNSSPSATSGAVAAWGANYSGQTTIPNAALSGVIAVAGGPYHALALRTNGTLVAWGYNGNGQINVPVSALTGVSGIAAGYFQSVAVKNDGRVVQWGMVFDGNNLVPASSPTDLSGVTAVSAGHGHAVGLKSDGSVVAWGWNGRGQTTVPNPAKSGVTAIAAGREHTVALKTDGTVVTWGFSGYGLGSVPAAAQSGVVAIAAGGGHSLALKNGSVIAWGDNQNGQTTVPPAAQSGVMAIAARGEHSVALKADGSVVAWGLNNAGQTNVPVAIQGTAIGIGAGSDFSMAIVRPTVPAITTQPLSQAREIGQTVNFTVTATGYPLFYQWQKDGIDIPGANAASYNFQVTQLTQAGNYSVVVSNSLGTLTSGPAAVLTLTALPPVITSLPVNRTVREGQAASFSVTATGSLLSYQWRKDGVAISGATGSTFNLGPVRADQAGAYTVVVSNVLGSITNSTPAVLTIDPLAQPAVGAVAAWGWNSEGQASVPVEARSGVMAVAGGEVHSLALKSDGSVVAWGSDNYSQTDVPEVANVGVAAISAGSYHSVALKNDGSVVAWGSNDYGQTTIPVVAQSGVTAIAAGQNHIMALKSDGSVVAWGSNDYGEIEVPLAAQSGVTAIAAGQNQSLALKSDGTVVAWGSTEYTGEVPAGLSGVVAIGAGRFNNAALKGDGTVVVWGNNEIGQSDVPEAAKGGVVAIAGGTHHFVALKGDGSLVSWGSNSSGQTNPPPGLTGILSIAAGANHTLAIVLPTAPTITGQPVNLTATAGRNSHFSVTATGYPLTYQWRMGGIDIPGATGSTYNLGPAQIAQAGAYDVVISNSLGSITSAPATLTVTPKVGGVVAAWGNNDFGQANVPVAAQSDVLSVAAGQYHSMALKTDGSLVAWGNNEAGQLDLPENARIGVTAIAAKGMNSVALKHNGSVVVWGWRNFVPESAQSGVAAVATSNYRTVALKSDGSSLLWFDGSEGVIPSSGRSGVAAVDVNENEILFLKTDGSVVGWVYIDWGFWQEVVRVPSGAIAVASGFYHGLALKSDGSVVGWGSNNYGEIDVPPAAQSGVVAIAAGESFSMALKADGNVVVWGNNDFQQKNFPSYLGGVTAIAAGGQHALAVAVPSAPTIVTLPTSQTVDEWYPTSLSVRATGFPLYFQWSLDGVNIPRATNATYSIANAGVSQSGRYSVVVSNSLGSSSSLGSPATLMVNPALPGAVVEWGGTFDGTNIIPAVASTEARSGVAQIAAGWYHTAALKADGSVITWGRIYNGATGAFEPASVPAGLTGVTALAAGDYFTVALKSDGSVVSWGSMYNGSGYGAPNVYANVQSGIKAIFAGGQRAYAVKIDGTVMSWGVVSDGRNNIPATPPPAAQTGVQAIAVGTHHTLALKNDGTVVAWGVTWNGNSYVTATVPAGLTGVTAIAAGQSHSLAVKADGTVVTWGFVFSATSNIYVPASSPAGLHGVIAVAAGFHHSAALKNDGTVVEWGTVPNGVSYESAAAPIGLKGVTAISAGFYRTVALLSDRPALLTRMSAEGLTLSWPSNESGYVLQTTLSLAPPVIWTEIPSLPPIVNERHTFKPTISEGRGFYRLYKP